MSDAKELREAIEQLHRLFPEREYSGWGQAVVTCRDAAEKHLATLPREVTVETWMLLDVGSMSLGNDHLSEDRAKHYENTRRVAVRLTGKALLPGSKE